MQYESPISCGKEVMTKVKVCFTKVDQTSRSRSRDHIYGTMCKVLLQGIHMCNMKSLSLPVRKLLSRFKFLFTHTLRR